MADADLIEELKKKFPLTSLLPDTKPDDHPMWLAEFGCFTGDCPHESWEQCLEAIGKDWLSQRAQIRTLQADLDELETDALLGKVRTLTAENERLKQFGACTTCGVLADGFPGWLVDSMCPGCQAEELA